MRPAAAAVAVALALASPAAAQPALNFAGKTVTIVASFAPGGDYDLYARLLAGHMGRRLPGSPAVVVQNMPGAGGLAGTNFLYNVAPRDGLTLGVIPQTVAIAQLIGAPGVKYDVRRFAWIGRINSNIEVMQTWHSSAVRTIEDAREREVVLAGTGPDSSSVVFPHVLNAMFGMKFKVVPGYEGVNMATLALERGEVQGFTRPWSLSKTVHPEWMSESKINTLLQLVGERRGELRDVPAVVELARDERERRVLGLFASGADIGRSIVAPPDVPSAVVAAHRAAFEATMTDPAFLADIQKSKMDFDPLSGRALQDIVTTVENNPAEVVEEARRLSPMKK